jgi:hypothetical protein
MRYKRRRRLSEAAESWIDSADTATMTDEEQWWHKKITAILLNKKGKWGPYQHALYALRFQDFILKIVPLSVDPHFTACVIFDRAVVYVGEGFLVDDKKCYQLNVIIRHELAHILLQHQIRMMHKIGELPYSKISMSASIHELINIIADFEISNKKYTSEDKGIVLNMYLNGKLISGLVTEMHREDWAKLPIEEMYDKLNEELDRIASDIADADGDLGAMRYSPTTRRLSSGDMITHKGMSTLAMYKDTKSPSVIWKPIEEYFAKSKQYKKIAPVWKHIIEAVYSEIKDYTETQLTELLNVLAASKPVETVVIGESFEVTAPEEKYWANQVIKNLLGLARERPMTTLARETHSEEYIKSYNRIIDRCGKSADCSDEELQEIMTALGLGGSTTTDEDEDEDEGE